MFGIHFPRICFSWHNSFSKFGLELPHYCYMLHAVVLTPVQRLCMSYKFSTASVKRFRVELSTVPGRSMSPPLWKTVLSMAILVLKLLKLESEFWAKCLYWNCKSSKSTSLSSLEPIFLSRAGIDIISQCLCLMIIFPLLLLHLRGWFVILNLAVNYGVTPVRKDHMCLSYGW